MLEHDCNAWIAKAISDLRSAKKLLKDDDKTLDTAAYHTQQCVEKTLKAFLVFNKQLPPKTHDLSKILEVCCAFDYSLKFMLNDIITLIPYAIHSRYPDDYFVICRDDVNKALKIAQNTIKIIISKMDFYDQMTIFDIS